MISAAAHLDDLLEAIAKEVELTSTPQRRLAEHRLAEHQLIEQVRFEMSIDRPWDGKAYRQLSDDLWLYAWPVVKAFLRTHRLQQVLDRCAPGRRVPIRPEDMVVLTNSEAARDELALDIIAAAIEHFRTYAIVRRKWVASTMGVSLRTYFINACALQFPRAYEKWAKERAGELDRLAARHDVDFEQVGHQLAGNIAADVAQRVDLARIIEAATPTTKLILGMLAEGMTQVQIAAELRVTVKAVERRLANFRKRVRTTGYAPNAAVTA
ncbi:hypothetical protein [Actinoplanes subglobosus]|uniref:Uncharacterized protein n=1 Tax=Actinoplanes subglobosus TaxID=1547892 RepID=A0ABV8IR88_9ACTN